MSSKIKPRQIKKPRSIMVRDMILESRGGSMRHTNDRRLKERNDVRQHIQEWENNDDCEW